MNFTLVEASLLLITMCFVCQYLLNAQFVKKKSFKKLIIFLKMFKDVFLNLWPSVVNCGNDNLRFVPLLLNATCFGRDNRICFRKEAENV